MNKQTQTATVQSGAPALSDAEHTIIGWLHSFDQSHVGKRVVLFTYNNSGYLGIQEEPEFIARYHEEGGRIVQSPLRRIKETDAVSTWVNDIGTAIQSLAAKGQIVQLPTPRQYEGAVIYGLAP